MRAVRLLRAGVPAVRGEGDLAMKRILALDVGDKRTGVAVSDELGITAQGVETIQTRGLERDAQRVAQLAGEYGTERILIGLPRKLDYSEGAQAEHSRAFGDKLAEMGFSVRYEDERLTTVMAQRALLEGDASRKRRKQVVDKIAAVLILQGFLDAGGWPEEDKEDTAMDGEMERDDIVELYDEDDNLVRFEHVMTIEYEGENYVLLAPLDEDEEGDEVIILRIEEQDGEEVYATLEDDDLINAVFSRYLEIVEEEDEDEN